MNLNNKTIIVVGGAGRIGRAIVGALVQADANVVVADVDESGLNSVAAEYGARVMCQTLDVSDATAIRRLLSDAEQRFGGVDGAVNTAYPRNARYGAKFYEVTYDDFCENVSRHVGAYFLFMQQCAQYALHSKRPFSLVNFSSIYGVMAPRFDVYEGLPMTMPVEYAAVKAGLQHLTSYATAFTKGTRFRVNCVSPGGILAGQNPDFLARYKAHCREKGMLDAEDIVGSVLYLLSSDSAYVCGQNIVIDDGFSVG